MREDRGVPLALVPFLLAGILTPAVVGLFVAVRRPENRIAWILLLGSLSVTLVMIASAIADHDPESAAGRWAATVAAPWPVIFLWPLALAFVFPDGALPSPRWRRVAWPAAIDGVGIVLLLIFAAHHAIGDRDVPSPLPLRVGDWALPIFWVFWAGLLLSLFAGAAAVRARYRAGDELLRRQVLWLAYGSLLIPLWLGGTSLLAVVGLSTDLSDVVTLTLLQAWPAVAVAIAITRHGLYSIDRLVNRTLVYAG